MTIEKGFLNILHRIKFVSNCLIACPPHSHKCRARDRIAGAQLGIGWLVNFIYVVTLSGNYFQFFHQKVDSTIL